MKIKKIIKETEKAKIYELECDNCNKIFIKRIENQSKQKYCYCCVKCAREGFSKYFVMCDEQKQHYSKLYKGENNPNYNNKWSADQRQIASQRMIQEYKDDPNKRYNAGKANRGKKFSETRKENMRRGKKKNPKHHSHTEKSKQLIGIKSKEKWTNEYKLKNRKKREELGQWIPLDQLDSFKKYEKESNWICDMIDYFNDHEKHLYNTIGSFNFKNTKGCVRDHILSRYFGFLYGLNPKLLRHPANMQYISHAENISKGFVDRKLLSFEIELMINHLIFKIKNYKLQWIEQTECIKIINEEYSHYEN